MDSGRLILVPTPIGNLEDITHRAIRCLREADLILAEDTRKSGVLLKHYSIETRMRSYHQHNEHKIFQELLALLISGTTMALITDAGTPGISDPGFLLVRACIEQGVTVECLPGAVAFIPALAASGLPSDRFHFEGFLPHKKGRQMRIKALANYPFTLVFYESPHRLAKTLQQLARVFGNDRKAVVARELTKVHETFVRGSLQSLAEKYENETVKGEIVVLVDGEKGK
ncbi:MAG: 16S rRNA (cytidine(1402)-2'-O)-methyltransferase [Bacteroidales bacterium]|nr:16S rRNA (cytidine(1402)-2'-O)-methyltransferase [Bacteroidales bacterium]